MILQIPCTKCKGQVLEREGLDGQEKVCLSCGFAQVPNIIPTNLLSNDSKFQQERDRNVGWVKSYGNWQDKVTKEESKSPLLPTRQKLSINHIKLWGRLKAELDLQGKRI
jgi:hypothetical protein